MKNYINILIVFCMATSTISAQTASVTSGCAELKVEFTAPNASTYFWEFGDGATSDLQNPEYSYVQPGDYTAILYESQGGVQVGDAIAITVYPEVEFEISADVTRGCAPLEINFQSSITAHPDLEISDIIWTFGDGGSEQGANVNYTYTKPGIYDISLKVTTRNNIKCDNPKIFSQYIVVEGANTGFTISKEVICDTPAEFFLVNETFNDDGAAYLWDFGNGDSITDRSPGSYTYMEEGIYTITLETITPAGCVTSFSKIVTVGSPVIDIANTNLCLLTLTPLDNTTIADEFIWNFIASDLDNINSVDVTSATPSVYYSTPGDKQVSLIAISEEGCTTATTVILTVEEPNSNFYYDPVQTCQDSFTFTMHAEDETLDSYRWTNSVTGRSGITTMDPDIDLQYVHPVRDEYYFNGPDSIYTKLIVTSVAGCVDTTYLSLPIQKAESIIIPDTDEACVPYDMTFEDKSISGSPIIDRVWDFGDGTTLDLGSQDTIIQHSYTEPGVYIVTLIVTDENGCTDISRQVPITIKEILMDTIMVGTGEGGDGSGGNGNPPSVVCVGDIYSLTIPESDFDMHVESIDGLLSHCWKSESVYHVYNDPGPFETAVTVEAERVLIDSISYNNVRDIKGSRSIIRYTAECSDPYTFTLDAGASKNADAYSWYIDSTLVSNDLVYVHTFDETGDYMVYLETTNSPDVTCKPHRDSTVILVRDVVAEMNIGDVFCSNIEYPLDASPSIDAGDGRNCQTKYEWTFEKQRNRDTVLDTLLHRFLPGNQDVILTAIDANGCVHSVSKNITVYGMAAAFDLDSTLCLNSPVELLDLTVADTTLTQWQWQLGVDSSDVQNPNYVFSEDDFDPNFEGDTITVELIVTDAIGCMDTISRTVPSYTIRSGIAMDNGPKICVDEMITFSATDYTANGSSLEFAWNFQDYGVIEEPMPSITFSDSTDINLELRYTEMSTGCTGTLDTLIEVFDIPRADFESDKDDVDVICFPDQIAFTNTSIEDGPILHIWDFGNGATSTLENPVIPFDKGIWEVSLIVRSFYGCQDTITKTYELVGPEGTFSIDKDFICPGEEITLTLENPVDVNSFTWDLGNGVQVDNENPLTYTYYPQSSITSFTPRLIIRTNDGGCEDIQELPITISSLDGDFSFETGLCPGELSLFATFDNAQDYYWEIDGIVVEDDSNPSISIDSDNENIEIYLSLTDENGCTIERSRTIDRPNFGGQTIEFPNVFSPNGDNINPTFNIVYDPDALESEVVVTTFRVYNRWGHLLYDNDSPESGWDGIYNKEKVPPNVYAYYIEVTIDGCDGIVRKGNVTVIR